MILYIYICPGLEIKNKILLSGKDCVTESGIKQMITKRNMWGDPSMTCSNHGKITYW